MESLGINVKKLRELKNLTQDYVASELNVSQSQYQRMEAGTRKWSEEKITKVADILGVTPETLYEFDEKRIFQTGNTNAVYNGVNHGAMNFHSIDSKMEKLYEDKISFLEAEIIRLKEKYGEEI